MPIVNDIAAVRADNSKTDRQKDLAIYDLKNAALLDIILNGKPAPQPIPPLIGRTFTLDGTDITVKQAGIVPHLANDGETVPMLMIRVELTKPPAASVTHVIYYTNPPVIPKSPSGNEKQDLIAAASEMLAQLPTT